MLGACHLDDRESFRLSPICIEGDEIAAGAWECSDPLVLDCNDGSVPAEIFVRLDEGACDGLDLQGLDGPFGPGHYDIVIVDGNTDDAVCTTELTVTDALAPFVETAELSLWPPNHSYYEVGLNDCIASVVDCDDDWTAAIEFVSSDEPVNDHGDGNTGADIVLLTSDTVNLRSERQGGGNGRVYTIGFAVTDHSGNSTHAQCRVVVDHDNGHGQSINDGDAYRVDAA